MYWRVEDLLLQQMHSQLMVSQDLTTFAPLKVNTYQIEKWFTFYNERTDY